LSCDVAIVGAGYTGLWAAYHLLAQDPQLRVVVLEREYAGFGASGRNGGWASALFAASWERVSREHGAAASSALRTALEQTVDDIGTWCADHAVDAHYVKGGALTVARTQAQEKRLRGSGDRGDSWLSASDLAARVRLPDAVGARFEPSCAAIHPMRLVRGLRRVVTERGGQVFESTRVRAIEPGRVETDRGTVRAGAVLRCTEGYTAGFPGERRTLAPIWSLVIATEPLTSSMWDDIGWAGRETLTDGRHLIIYSQRTADGRIVFGGRGAPYVFGSGTTGRRGHTKTWEQLEESLRSLFPAAASAAISHRWGGVLGVPRDWMPAVHFDAASRVGWAGGYVGDGVGCAALAGRTLADLVLGKESDLTRLPWVGHQWRKWEPEPLRWTGIRGMSAVMASADRAENRTGRPSRRADLAERLLGG
jgi:glycine/D-amino acid oxidase-like deaminating enzyme